MSYVEGHNDAPKPIVWTKAADEIPETIVAAEHLAGNSQAAFDIQFPM